MELRVNADVDAIKTPTGYIPRYEDLKKLFREVLEKDYSEEEYTKQFTIKVKANLEKIERITEIYKTKIANVPDTLYKFLLEQMQRLTEVEAKHGEDVAPSAF